MNKIIEKIARLRDDRGWTNYRLSVEANIGTGTILNWYKRNVTPKLEAIQSVCNAFGITLAEFFNEEKEIISLTDTQKEFLAEYDQLYKEEKQTLLNFIKTINMTRKNFPTK